eukprot:1445947-Rhodomonas_salina.1
MSSFVSHNVDYAIFITCVGLDWMGLKQSFKGCKAKPHNLFQPLVAIRHGMDRSCSFLRNEGEKVHLRRTDKAAISASNASMIREIDNVVKNSPSVLIYVASYHVEGLHKF